MTLRPLRTHRPQIVDANKVERLGRARGTEHLRFRGAEYFVSMTLATPDEAPEIEGAIVLQSLSEIENEARGQRMPTGHIFRLAEPVPPGTFERQRPRRSTRGLRATDALGGLHLLRPRSSFIMPSQGAELGPVGLSPRPRGFVEGRGQIRGRAILEAVEGKGALLPLRHGALLPLYASSEIPVDVRRSSAKPSAYVLASSPSATRAG